MRRVTALLLSGVLAAGMLTGCGNSAAPKDDTKAAEAKTDTTGAAQTEA